MPEEQLAAAQNWLVLQAPAGLPHCDLCQDVVSSGTLSQTLLATKVS